MDKWYIDKCSCLNNTTNYHFFELINIELSTFNRKSSVHLKRAILKLKSVLCPDVYIITFFFLLVCNVVGLNQVSGMSLEKMEGNATTSKNTLHSFSKNAVNIGLCFSQSVLGEEDHQTQTEIGVSNSKKWIPYKPRLRSRSWSREEICQLKLRQQFNYFS